MFGTTMAFACAKRTRSSSLHTTTTAEQRATASWARFQAWASKRLDSERTISADRIAPPLDDGHGLLDVTTSVFVTCSLPAEGGARLTDAVCPSCSGATGRVGSWHMTEETPTRAVSVVIPMLNGE